MTFSLEWRMLYQVGNNFHFWGFQFFRRAHKYCYVYPLRQNQDPFPRLCTVYYFLWFFLLYLCIPSLPWLATVWTCCLKFREGCGGTERLPGPGAPQGTAWFQISFYCLGKLWYSILLYRKKLFLIGCLWLQVMETTFHIGLMVRAFITSPEKIFWRGQGSELVHSV